MAFAKRMAMMFWTVSCPVVVDVKDILLVEDLRDDVGEPLRGLEVVAKRLR